jgi:hypothetical protein
MVPESFWSLLKFSDYPACLQAWKVVDKWLQNKCAFRSLGLEAILIKISS